MDSHLFLDGFTLLFCGMFGDGDELASCYTVVFDVDCPEDA